MPNVGSDVFEAASRKRVVIDATTSRAPASGRKVIVDATNKKDHIVGSGEHLPAEKRELPVPGRFFAAPSRPSTAVPKAAVSNINIFSTEPPRRASSVTLARPVAGAAQRPSCRRFCPRHSDSLVIQDASAQLASAPRSGTPPRTSSTFLRFDGEEHSSIRFGIRVSPNPRMNSRGILPGGSEPSTPQRRDPQQCNMEKVLTGDPTAPTPRCSALRTNIRKNSPPSVDFRSSTATLRHPIATPQPSTLFGCDKGQKPGICSWDYKFSAMYRPQGSYLIRQEPPAAQRNRETQQDGPRGVGKKRASSAPRSQVFFS
jgi:hypothetical protein